MDGLGWSHSHVSKLTPDNGDDFATGISLIIQQASSGSFMWWSQGSKCSETASPSMCVLKPVLGSGSWITREAQMQEMEKQRPPLNERICKATLSSGMCTEVGESVAVSAIYHRP